MHHSPHSEKEQVGRPPSSPLVKLRKESGRRSPTPEFSRALKKLESRAYDRLVNITSSSYPPQPAVPLSVSGRRADSHAMATSSSLNLRWPYPAYVENAYHVYSDDRPPEMHEDAMKFMPNDGNLRELGALPNTHDETPRPTYARALWDYNENYSGHLTLRKGDIIQVFTKLATGWWDGQLDGCRGWFPGNYCELLRLGYTGAEMESSNEPDLDSQPQWTMEGLRYTGAGMEPFKLVDPEADFPRQRPGPAMLKSIKPDHEDHTQPCLVWSNRLDRFRQSMTDILDFSGILDRVWIAWRADEGLRYSTAMSRYDEVLAALEDLPSLNATAVSLVRKAL